MIHDKQKIIDFIIENDELISDIIRKTNEQIKDVNMEFKEEARNQQLEAIHRQVIDQISVSLGLTFGDIEDIIGIEEIEMIRRII